MSDERRRPRRRGAGRGGAGAGAGRAGPAGPKQLEKKLTPEARSEVRRGLAKRAGPAGRGRAARIPATPAWPGRELDAADVIASKAYVDALAARLRGSGLFGGPPVRLRALVLTDLTPGPRPPRPPPRWSQRLRLFFAGHEAAPGRRRAPPPPHPRPDGGSPARRPSRGLPQAPRPATGGDPLACRAEEETESTQSDTPGSARPRSEYRCRCPRWSTSWSPPGTLLGCSATPPPRPAAGACSTPTTPGPWSGPRPGAPGPLVHDHHRPRRTTITHGCAAGQRPSPPQTGPPDRAQSIWPAQGPAPSYSAYMRRLNITLEPIARGTLRPRPRPKPLRPQPSRSSA